MPIDPAAAIGAALPDRTFSWSTSDVLLYHLAIGAGARPGDHLDPTALRYTYDSPGLQVLPSFAVVAPSFHETEPPAVSFPGCQLDLAAVVHGSQEIHVHTPIPPSGTATLRTRITDIWDKGNAAVIWQEGTAVDEDGTDLWTVRSSIFARGEGGFGGRRHGVTGEAPVITVPDREPDLSVTYDVTAQQALLYRLCGDRNPLHADPAFAQGAGFPAPILHGLCTWGITLREGTDGLLGGDAGRVTGWGARFAGVVLPGDALQIRGWRTPDGIAVDVEIANGARAGSPVLADGLLRITGEVGG